MKMLKAPLAVAISVATFGQLAVADEASVTTLNQIVVTASRSEASVSDISGTVQVISQEEIIQQSQPGQKLADVLEQIIPGFGPSTQTVTDRTQSMRGRKALVLIDGISQADNRQISRQISSIRPENIERIEVISGASAIYGGGATGGIINIITRQPEGDKIRFASEGGIKISDDRLTSYTLSQSISGRQDNFDYLLSGTYESRGGIFGANGQRINPDPSQVSRMDSDTKDALIKLGYDLNNEQRLEATLQLFRDQMDSDYAPNYGDLSVPGAQGEVFAEPVKGLNLSDQPYTDRDSISFVFTDEDFLGQRLDTLVYYREREARFYPFSYDFRANVSGLLRDPNGHLTVDNDYIVNQSTSTSEAYGFKLVLDKEFDEQFRTTYGFDYDVDSGEQKARSFDGDAFVASNGLNLNPVGDYYDYGPDVRAKKFGVFFQNAFAATEDLTINFGWRYEKHKLDISDYNPIAETWYIPLYDQDPFNPLFQNMRLSQAAAAMGRDLYTPLKGGKKKYDANLINAGLVYQLGENQELFINYSQGFEVPDAARLLRNTYSDDSILTILGTAFTPGATPTSVNNANLDAIKIDSYELGWRGDFSDFSANVTAFYNESDKTIDFNADYSVDLLDQEKKVYGIEASADYLLNDNWFVGGSYAFTEGRSYYEKVGQWIDLQAADVSPQKMTAHVTYEQSDMNLRLQAVSFSDYDKGGKLNNKNEIVKYDIDGYTTFDLLASFELPVGTAKVGITNLFNKDYETVYSQWANTTYGSLSAHKAEGRAYNLSYRVEY